MRESRRDGPSAESREEAESRRERESSWAARGCTRCAETTTLPRQRDVTYWGTSSLYLAAALGGERGCSLAGAAPARGAARSPERAKKLESSVREGPAPRLGASATSRAAQLPSILLLFTTVSHSAHRLFGYTFFFLLGALSPLGSEREPRTHTSARLVSVCSLLVRLHTLLCQLCFVIRQSVCFVGRARHTAMQSLGCCF